MSRCLIIFFFFKQKTAYEMRISDWSSDVCSSDLPGRGAGRKAAAKLPQLGLPHKACPVGRHSGGAVAGRRPLPATDYLLLGGPRQALAPQLDRKSVV